MQKIHYRTVQEPVTLEEGLRGSLARPLAALRRKVIVRVGDTALMCFHAMILTFQVEEDEDYVV